MFNNKKVHLIGIGGISMSSIALMLLNMNASVSGSDIQESALTKKLEEKGIIIKYGHHPEMVKDADIIVYTAAICKDDPERIAIKNENKENYERAEFLGIMMKEFKNSLCVSGTHGKSTTTGMLSLIFLEASEYVDSFLHFHPTSAIITNIDNDHLDYFKNLDNIKKSFYKYVSLLPQNGYLVKNNDDGNSSELDKYTKATVITYGINNKANYVAKNITCNDLGHYSYDLYLNDEFLTSINLNINGKHNIYNSLAAFALSHQYIKDINIIKNALEKYHGVGRRFEFLGTYKDALIYDDYAHHPSEIKTTLESVKGVKHNESWAIFQSHTYSRTAEHLDAFADVLSKFDHIIIAKIFPAREVNIYNISEDMLVDKIKEKNPNVCYIEDFNKIIEYLDKNIKPNDLVISIGAGPINTNVTKKLIEK